MFGLKKIIPVLAAVAALAVPSLALADDHDHGRSVDRRDEHAIVELRDRIARDRIDMERDLRMHRWEEARRVRREIDRTEQVLRDMIRR